MKEILIQHIKTHPAITTQDILKLCYQATFGAEHLLMDREKAFLYFDKEWQMTPETDEPMVEILSCNYARLNLGAWKRAGLPAEWLFRMFFSTASTPSSATVADLQSRLEQVDALTASAQLPFSKAKWDEACVEYWKMGGGAVHHSEQYRMIEKPAYRLVHRRYLELIPILEKIAHVENEKVRTVTVAIDGRAASGKTTLADKLAVILDTDVIHMDDFFLPPELRSRERLAQAGGNVHYERFATEVVPYLKNNASFDYSIFSCQKMQLDGNRTIRASKWRVIEGSYSHHPELSAYMDVKVFCTVSSEEQRRRILVRNGEQMAEMFAQRWIPMEEKYFSSYKIKDCSDIIIDTEKGGQI